MDSQLPVLWIRAFIADNVLHVSSTARSCRTVRTALRARVVLAFILVAAVVAWGCSESSEKATPKDIVYEASGSGGAHVYRVNPETGVATQVTTGSSVNRNPAWSPDGDQIVFISDRGGAQEDIHVMDADGSNMIQLTETEARELAPKFSPDGTSIAFARNDGEDWSLWLMKADGSGAKEIAGPYRYVEFPSWRPDRNEIFFSAIETGGGAADVFRVDLDTGEITVAISTPGADVCPHFSHDGKWLTYATDIGDAGEIDVFRHDLASPATDGAADVRLTDSPGVDDYANYSPDDTQLVFVTRRGGEAELYLMDEDGTNQRPLTQTAGLQENVPDW